MRRFVLTGLLFACTAAGTAAAQTLEEIAQKLAEAYQKVESLSADFRTTQNISMGGMEQKMDLKGEMEMLRDGGQLKVRMEQTGQQSFAGQQQDIKMLMVSDGVNTWVLNEQGDGQKMAMKMKAEPEQAQDPKAMLEAMREAGDVKVVGDEQIDGQDTWVLEITPSGPAAQAMARQKMWFRKDIGMQVQMIGYDASGKEVMKSVVTDVKLNPSIPEDRFTFTPPEGVQVMDMTNMPEMPQQESETPETP